MAAGQLTNRQYMELGSAISVRIMRKIALGYLDLSDSTIKNIEADHLGDAEAQSREMLRRWAYRNPGNQVKGLAVVLYQAANNGDLDPHAVERILGVTKVKEQAQAS